MPESAVCLPIGCSPFSVRLRCPVCGDTYVHPAGVTCNPAGPSGCVSINEDGVEIVRGLAPYGRGVHLELIFDCEQGHTFSHVFHFHKGETFLSGEELPAAEGVRTIWRD